MSKSIDKSQKMFIVDIGNLPYATNFRKGDRPMLMGEWMGGDEWRTLEDEDWEKLFALPLDSRKTNRRSTPTKELLRKLHEAREIYPQAITHVSDLGIILGPCREELNRFFKRHGNQFQIVYNMIWVKVDTSSDKVI